MTFDLSFLDRVSILVVGDIMLDRYVWGEVRRISPEAPVPVLEIDRETYAAGGAANVALNLAALGVRCEVFGIVGNDAAGNELRALFDRNRITFDARLLRAASPTVTKTRIMAKRQQLCRLDQEANPPAYAVDTPELLALLSEKAAQYDAVILSDYAKGVISQPVIDALRGVRANRRLFVALDPKPSRPLDIGGLDLLTPNGGEALQLVGAAQGRQQPDMAAIVAGIDRQYRPGCLVITLNERGMLLRAPDGVTHHLPTVARQVADVTGAGDTVMATLTAAMAAGIQPRSAVHIANSAAGVVIGKLGTATLNRDELAAALAADGNLAELNSTSS